VVHNLGPGHGLADGKPFAFAGLWERWKAPEGEIVVSCTVITADANELLMPIHDPMRVILKVEDYDLWLDPQVANLEELKALLKPYKVQITKGMESVTK
jgi:putative SOS response-associated peptidase YedK